MSLVSAHNPAVLSMVSIVQIPTADDLTLYEAKSHLSDTLSSIIPTSSTPLIFPFSSNHLHPVSSYPTFTLSFSLCPQT